MRPVGTSNHRQVVPSKGPLPNRDEICAKVKGVSTMIGVGTNGSS